MIQDTWYNDILAKKSFFVKNLDIHSNLQTSKCSFILTTSLQTPRWLRSLPERSGRGHHICSPRWARIPLKVQLALKVHHKLYHLIYHCQHHWNRQGEASEWLYILFRVPEEGHPNLISSECHARISIFLHLPILLLISLPNINSHHH